MHSLQNSEMAVLGHFEIRRGSDLRVAVGEGDERLN
jgi:hypothetical protein